MCNFLSSRHEFRRLPAPNPALQSEFVQSTRDNLWIFTREWLVPVSLVPSSDESKVSEIPRVRGLIFICHGYGEHCGRYEMLAKYFNSLGFHVFSQDHIGHGRSQGTRAHVEDFQDYVKDFISLIRRVQEKFSTPMPTFLFAHSMGGLIGLHIMRAITLESVKSPFLNQCWPFTGVILSAPALKPDPKQDNSFMRGLAKCCSGCMPKFGIDSLPSSYLSRVKSIGESYDEDSLNYHGNVRAKLGFEMLKSMDLIRECCGELQFPYLLIQGSSDRLVNPVGAREFHEKSGSKDKTYKEYEGGYHELFVDTIADQVLADIKQWIESKMEKKIETNNE